MLKSGTIFKCPQGHPIAKATRDIQIGEVVRIGDIVLVDGPDRMFGAPMICKICGGHAVKPDNS